MKETELKPYSDYEKIRKQADQYIEMILIGASRFERHGQNITPTVFMSNDVFAILASASDRALYVNREYYTICGYKVEAVMGTNKLYIGCDLLGKENML